MSPSRKHFLLLKIPFLLFYLFPFLVSSQTVYSVIKHDQVDIVIEKWTNKDGMPYTPGTFMRKAFQDSRGFMWICPNNSLIRFDGNRFKEYYYKPNDQGVFTQIEEDLAGNLWLVSFEKDHPVLVFNPRQECFYTIEEYLEATSYPSEEFLNHQSLRIFSIEKDIFIISGNATQIWKYDGQLRQVFKEKSTEFYNYLPGPDGLFWKMTQAPNKRDSVFLVDSIGNPVRAFPTSINFQNHFIDDNYQLWNVDHTPNHQNQPFDIKEIIRPIDRKPTLAVPTNIHTTRPYYHASAHSDYILYGDHEKMTLLQHNQVIIDDIWPLLKEAGLYSYSDTYSIEVSNDGSFWIPFNGYLLHIQFKEKKFTQIFKGYSIRHISSIEKDRKILITGYKISPFLLDLQQQEQQYISVKDPNYYYFEQGDVYHYSGYPDKNYIWFGSSSYTLHQYDYVTGETIAHELDSLLNWEARAFYFLSDSTFLFCSNIGLHSYNHKTQKIQHLIERTPAYWIHEDQKGDLWVATHKGLYHLPTQTYYLGSLNDHILSIKHIYEAPNGDFWLSTNQGLIHWKPFGEIYQRVSTEDGLSNNTIHAVYPDKRGVLWLSTNYGVSAFAPQNNHIQNFFETDGLLDNEQNYLAHLSTSDGRIFFGGITGVNAFYPDSIPLYDDSLYYDIYIGTTTLLDADQQSLDRITPGSTEPYSLSLSPSCNQISIEVALPYFDEYPIAFQWRIPGIFNNWNDIKENQITINGLPAGEYQLELQAYPANNPGNILNKKISIHKRAFFYQQLWFWIACIINISMVIWLLYRWRTSKLTLQAKVLEHLVEKRTEELKQQNEIIEKQNHHLEEINQAKNQLFNNISHEFRTPLSLISGYNEELLNHPNRPEWIYRPVSKIKKHTELLSEMINEILSLQKIDSGILPLHKSAENWTELVKKEFNLFNGLAQKKQLIYRLEIVPDKACIVAIDQKKVVRILQNLIGNAIKYTPEKGQVIVRTEILKEELLFTVKDNGHGIPIDEKGAIFKRFYQGKTTKGAAQPGYGIGLALSSEYAKLMAGALWVESQPNKGATFFFRLAKEELDNTSPLAIAEPIYPSSLEVASAIQSTSSGKTNKNVSHILIIEDNEDLLAFLTDQLSKHYQVTALTNGQLALDFLTQNNHIDLIISDIMMPVMDGKALLKAVRKDAKLAFIPFLMLTALHDLTDKIEAFRLGADGYLTKPFDLEELYVRVANLIQYRQPRKPIGETNLLQGVPEAETSEVSAVSYNEEWFRTFDSIIKKELTKSDLKIVDITYQLHISERTLRNRIKEHTGMSPSEYITKARLNLALPLVLQHKYATVAEVAYACGFKNARYFSQQFKKEFGKRPSEY